MAKPAVRYDFFLQWQGQTLYFSKDRMTVNRSKIAGSGSFCYVFTDFPQDEGPGQVFIQGDVRYAEILARRQAEQKGELGPDSVFHTYWKVKHGKNEAELIYHIIPRSMLQEAKNACRVPAGCVLMDWTGLLLSLLKKAGKKDQAIALHAESSILVVAGNSSRVKLVRRYQVFTGKKGGLGNVSGMIEHDLELCRREKSADFSELQWIEVYKSSTPDKLPQMGIQVRPWPMARYTQGNQTVWSALPFLLNAVDPGLALYGSGERYVRPLQTLEKWACLILAVSAATMGYITWMNQEADEKLNARVAMLEQEVQSLEKKVQGHTHNLEGIDDIAGTIDLAGDISRALAAPSPVRSWNLFFGSWPKGWALTTISMTYENRYIKIQAQGLAESDPKQTARQSSRFRRELVRNGFEINEVDMNLMSEEAEFVIMVSYPWTDAEKHPDLPVAELRNLQTMP